MADGFDLDENRKRMRAASTPRSVVPGTAGSPEFLAANRGRVRTTRQLQDRGALPAGSIPPPVTRARGPVGPSAYEGSRPPFTGRFKFKIGNLEIGAFQQVSGLSVEMDAAFEIKEGGHNEFVHRFPGRMKWPNLVLKRGITNDNHLFDWFNKSSGEGFAGQANRLTRYDVTLEMVDAQGNKLRSWTFMHAFPVKWKGPEFAADSSSVATEELEVAHHGFRVDV